jgi:hypothetical protein
MEKPPMQAKIITIPFDAANQIFHDEELNVFLDRCGREALKGFENCGCLLFSGDW